MDRLKPYVHPVSGLIKAINGVLVNETVFGFCSGWFMYKPKRLANCSLLIKQMNHYNAINPFQQT